VDYNKNPSSSGSDVLDGNGQSGYGPGETILIAEDDILTASSMKKILEHAGYRAVMAMDGEEALTIFRERHEDISLIVSDVIMPRRSGVDFLNEVRRIRPHVRMLFVSGYSANILDEKGISREGTQFLTKPFAKQELVQRVRELLEGL
jgi:DNA-binding response OmpR family regulator